MSIIEKALGKRDRGGAAERARQPVDQRGGAQAQRSTAAMASERVAAPPATPNREPVEIDLHQLRRRGVWPPANMETQLRDEYRRIKRPLLKNARGLGGNAAVSRSNLISVTSSVAGEGKTFTAVNLALSMAQEPDCAVLFVDGDVSRRNASQLLEVGERPGLVDLLADQSLRAEDVIVPTTVDSLSLMPAGRPHALSTELLASARMESVVTRIAAPGARQIVIFDSSPLLSSSESVSLAALVGQIVMVVKAESTKPHDVLAALDQLDTAKPINMVLNQSKRIHGENYYGGYYGDHGAD